MKNSYNEIRKTLVLVKKSIEEGKLSPPGNYPNEESVSFFEKLKSKIDSALKVPKRRCEEYEDWKDAYGDFVRSDEFVDAVDEDIFEWIFGIDGDKGVEGADECIP